MMRDVKISMASPDGCKSSNFYKCGQRNFTMQVVFTRLPVSRKKKAFFWVSSVALATLACKYGDVDLQQVA
jgi:hypothetical protein